MMEKTKAFCIECGEERDYNIRTELVEIEVNGVTFSYNEQSAFCAECGEELYVPEINDRNVEAREEAYRKAAGLITTRQIDTIMDRYDIGVKPLSLLMGFGEVTISRYQAGSVPSKANSDQLFKVLASREEMRKCLRVNGTKLTKIARKKCEDAINRLDDLYDKNKINVAARYLIYKTSDVTPLALQKMLYYAKSFYHAIFGGVLFEDHCQAWVHGPVFPDVYEKYREYGYNPLDKALDVSEEEFLDLTEKETALLDAIVQTFGKYSGGILRNITHAEKPWLMARGDLAPEERSDAELDESIIEDYFAEVVEKYHIINPCDIKKYCDVMIAETAS